MNDFNKKSHGIDLTFSDRDLAVWNRKASGYFGVNLSQGVPKAYLSGQIPDQRDLLDSALRLRLGSDNRELMHPSLPTTFKASEYRHQFHKLVEDYSRELAQGLTSIVLNGCEIGSQKVSAKDITTISIRINTGVSNKLIDFSEIWERVLDSNLGNGINLRRLIQLKEANDWDTALALLETLPAYQSWLKQYGPAGGAPLSNESAATKVKAFLNQLLVRELEDRIRRFLVQTLNQEFVYSPRGQVDTLRIFSSENKTPFLMRVGFNMESGNQTDLPYASYIEIPSSEVHFSGFKPISDDLSKLGISGGLLANLERASVFIIAQLLTEYRIAQKKGKAFSNNLEAIRFLELLNNLYEVDVQKHQNQNTPWIKNVFVWLLDVSARMPGLREELTKNFLRLFTPGYLLTDGNREYVVFSAHLRRNQATSFIPLFQRDDATTSLMSVAKEGLMGIGQISRENSLRRDILSLDFEGINFDFYGFSIDQHNAQNNLARLGLQELLNFPAIRDSEMQRVRQQNQAELEAFIQNGGKLFPTSASALLERWYNQCKINLGHSSPNFSVFLQGRNFRFLSDSEMTQNLPLYFSPPLQSGQQATSAQGPQRVMTREIIYDPITGFKLQE